MKRKIVRPPPGDSPGFPKEAASRALGYAQSTIPWALAAVGFVAGLVVFGVLSSVSLHESRTAIHNSDCFDVTTGNAGQCVVTVDSPEDCQDSECIGGNLRVDGTIYGISLSQELCLSCISDFNRTGPRGPPGNQAFRYIVTRFKKVHRGRGEKLSRSTGWERLITLL
jgi:hypothetical protein